MLWRATSRCCERYSRNSASDWLIRQPALTADFSVLWLRPHRYRRNSASDWLISQPAPTTPCCSVTSPDFCCFLRLSLCLCYSLFDCVFVSHSVYLTVLPVSLSVRLSVHLSVCLSVSLFVIMSDNFWLSVCLSVCLLSVCLPVSCLSVSLSNCSSVNLSVSLSDYLSVCQSVC